MNLRLLLICIVQQWVNIDGVTQILNFERGGDTTIKVEGSHTSLCYDTECTAYSRMENGIPREVPPWKADFPGHPEYLSVENWEHVFNEADADGKAYTQTMSFIKMQNNPGDQSITTVAKNVTFSSDNAEYPFSSSKTMNLAPGALWSTMSVDNWRFKNVFDYIEYKFTILLYDEHNNATDLVKTPMSNGATRYSVGGTSYFELYPITLSDQETQELELSVTQAESSKKYIEVYYRLSYYVGEVQVHCVLGDTKLTDMIAPTGYTPTTVVTAAEENLATKLASFESLQVNDTMKAYYTTSRGFQVECCLTADCKYHPVVQLGPLYEEGRGSGRSGSLNVTHAIESPWKSPVVKQGKNGVNYTETYMNYTLLQHGTNKVQISVYLRALAEETTIDLGGKEYTFPKKSFVYELVYDGKFQRNDPQNVLSFSLRVQADHISTSAIQSLPISEQGSQRYHFKAPIYFEFFPLQVGSETQSSFEILGYVYRKFLGGTFEISNVTTTTRYILAMGETPPSDNPSYCPPGENCGPPPNCPPGVYCGPPPNCPPGVNCGPPPNCPPGMDCGPPDGSSSGSAGNDVLQDDGLKPDEEKSNATGTVLIILAVLAILAAAGYYQYRKKSQRMAQSQDLKKAESVAPIPASGKMNETKIQEAVVKTE